MIEMSAPPARGIPAATVVVFRHCPRGGPPELLVVERADTMRFAAGAAVFPGGRIDDEDCELARRLFPQADPGDAAARIAGVRETLEETGLALSVTRPVSGKEAAEARALLLEDGRLAAVIERHGWSFDLERLVPFARWCPDHPKAFDTRFYIHDLGSGQVDIAVDATENSRLHWLSAPELLRRADSGELKIIFPTRRNLERIAQFATFADTAAHARAIPVRTITPSVEQREGVDWLTIPEGLGYPVVGEPLTTARRT